MAEIIALIIFIGSLCGIGVILFRKIPAIKELSIDRGEEEDRQILDDRKKVKQTNLDRFVCFEKFSRKFCAQIKVFKLKSQNLAQDLSDKARERRERKNNFLYDKGEDNIEENDIREIKVKLQEKLKKEPKPEIEDAIEKDDYWEKLKKFRKNKVNSRKIIKKRKKKDKD
jgi:hypothetical protein